MRKEKKFLRKVCYICLSYVFVFGMMAIVACDGNSGGGEDPIEPIDNSKFYGTFAFSINVDECDVIEEIIVIGGEGEDFDYYIPENSNFATDSEIDEGVNYTQTVTVTADTVTYDFEEQTVGELSPSQVTNLVFVYSNDYNDITISGNATNDDDPEECQGELTGSAIRQ
jgi:hypothetical protein